MSINNLHKKINCFNCNFGTFNGFKTYIFCSNKNNPLRIDSSSGYIEIKKAYSIIGKEDCFFFKEREKINTNIKEFFIAIT